MTDYSPAEANIREYWDKNIAPYSQQPVVQFEDMVEMHQENARVKKHQLQKLIDEFDSAWDDLWLHVQMPIQVDRYSGDARISAYTGHRQVVLPGLGRTALGFQLVQEGRRDHRTIVAFRRKIYPSDTPRSYFVADSLHMSKSQIRGCSGLDEESARELAYDVGIIRVWADKFIEAEPYD